VLPRSRQRAHQAPWVGLDACYALQHVGARIIDDCYPTGRGHIVCDNLSAHDTDDVLDWFEEHPRWTRHFTPKHASWLNQIECMFSVLQKQVLARGSFTSIQDLQEKIYAYMLWYNETAQPFEWTYRPKSWSRKRGQTSGGLH
jgi:transposase